MEQKRLDIYVMELRGFSRAYAKEVIEAGLVLVNGKQAKPGQKVGQKVSKETVEVMANDMPYVSRGGYKLEAALKAFNIDLTGLECLDAGASTGGFTDCMIKYSAKSVIAADVGHGQLAEILKNDGRVLSMEGTDIRDLILDNQVDFAAADLSFISLTAAIPTLAGLVKPGGRLVCLIKPQFETGGKGLSKNGIVKTEKLREKAKSDVISALKENGFNLKGIIQSPITGRDGNIEYLAYSIRTYLPS